MIAVELKDIEFAYDNKREQIPILSGVNFDVKEGEFVSFVGASGSGKSTIFQIIAGLQQPQYGSVLLHGANVQKRLGKVGYMPQQDLLMPWRTVFENARLPLEMKKLNPRKHREMLHDMLEEFGLGEAKDKYPHELSGGMRQRLSFLRTTLTGAHILLLDEPFSALDAMTKLFMQEWLLSQWEKRKQTILFITHDIQEALFLSDRIYILDAKPIQQLTEIEVPLQRPRSQKDLQKQEIVQLQHELIESFRTQVTI